jgi:hypothetical protein
VALRGKIEDYGLTDVLQLIVRRGKSGMITLSNGGDEVHAGIDNGSIISVENTGRPTESELASRLARAGMINSAQLGTVLKRRAETGEQMAVVLIAERCATEATLRPFTTAQALDTLFEVFDWETGTYAFEEQSLEAIPRTIEPISMEFLLINGHRAIEEWPAIRRTIPSKSMTIHRLRPLPEPGVTAHADLIEDLQLDASPPVEVEADERLVYELCLPGIAVRTVIDRAPLSRFQTMLALASLIQHGYVRLS